MNDKLIKLRKDIDDLDQELLKLISARVKKVEEIGRIKRTVSLGTIDTNRKNEVLSNWKKFAKKENLSEKTFEKIYKIIHDYSVIIEKNIK